MCPTLFISAWPCSLFLRQDAAPCTGSLVPLLFPSAASLSKTQTLLIRSLLFPRRLTTSLVTPAIWIILLQAYFIVQLQYQDCVRWAYKWYFECLFGGFSCVWCCFGSLLSSFSLRNNRLFIYSLGFNNHRGNYQKPQLQNITHLHLLFQCYLLSFIMEMGWVKSR